MYLANAAGSSSVEINQEVQNGSKALAATRLQRSLSQAAQRRTKAPQVTHTAEGAGVLLSMLAPTGQP